MNKEIKKELDKSGRWCLLVFGPNEQQFRVIGPFIYEVDTRLYAEINGYPHSAVVRMSEVDYS